MIREICHFAILQEFVACLMSFALDPNTNLQAHQASALHVFLGVLCEETKKSKYVTNPNNYLKTEEARRLNFA